MPTRSLTSIRRNSVSSVPSQIRVSGFRTSTYSAVVSRRTRLLAALKPTFSSSAISLTSGNSRGTTSAVPSPESLSTTVMRSPRAGGCSCKDRRHSRSIEPQRYETITTSSTALHGSASGLGVEPLENADVACRKDRRTRAPEMPDTRVVPADALFIRIGGVVLLGDEVREERVGECFVAVRMDARHVDRNRVVVADVLRERLAGRPVENDDAHHSREADEEVVLAPLVIVEPADDALSRAREVH